MTTNIVAIIQARMRSTRLPGKALLELRGLPIIDWVTRRVAVAKLLRGSIVAIPDGLEDDILADHLKTQGVAVFRGPEDDVLARFHLAALQTGASHVVRVCADNPLIWGGEIDNLIRHFLRQPEQDNLYAYNHIPLDNQYPDGLGAEMVSADLLHHLHDVARLPAHREHCLLYIRDKPELFHISTFDPPDKRLWRPELKLDVDTAEDLGNLARMPVRPDMPPEEIVALYAKED